MGCWGCCYTGDAAASAALLVADCLFEALGESRGREIAGRVGADLGEAPSKVALADDFIVSAPSSRLRGHLYEMEALGEQAAKVLGDQKVDEGKEGA